MRPFRELLSKLSSSRELMLDKPVTYKVALLFDHYALAKLAEQKLNLLQLQTRFDLGVDFNENLDGLVCVIDSIQDEVEATGNVDVSIIFPFTGTTAHDIPNPDILDYRAALQALLKNLEPERLPVLMNIDPHLDKALTRIFKDGKL